MGGFRQFVFSLHKWFGLNIALFFAMMFLTGALLTVADEVEKFLNPEIKSAARKAEGGASFGDIFDAAMRADPGGTVFVIELQPIDGAGDRAYMGGGGKGQRMYWTDTTTADVLAVTSPPGFEGVVKELHDSLLVPSRYVYLAVSATSLVLLYSVVSGLITYRRFWRGWFRFPTGDLTPRAKWAAWHRLIGLWLSPFLLIMGVTGFYFFLGGLNLLGTGPTQLRTEEREIVRPNDFSGATIDAAYAAVMDAYPWLVVSTAVLPGNKRAGIGFAGYREGQSRLVTYSAAVHPETLEILGMNTSNDGGFGTDIKQLMNMLHFGTWGGNGIRYLWTALGVATAGLVFAGTAVYAARTAPLDGMAGGIRRFWRGLGIFRFAYMGVVVGLTAMVVLRYLL